jgi:Predicted acetyltransferase
MFKLAAQQAAKLNVRLVVDPSVETLQQLLHWLRDEYEHVYSGFYTNWDIIQNRFENHQIVLLQVNGVAAGFVCWYGTNSVVFIDIVEVRPEMRRCGLGRFMVEECLHKLGEMGCVVVGLECPFIASLPFWRRLEFLPNIALVSCVNERMYKVLSTSVAQSVIENPNGCMVELWDTSPEETGDREANWKWNIQFENNSNKLKNPIVFPSHPAWRIRVRTKETILADTEIRSFGMNQIYLDGFLIIERLDIEHI